MKVNRSCLLLEEGGVLLRVERDIERVGREGRQHARAFGGERRHAVHQVPCGTAVWVPATSRGATCWSKAKHRHLWGGLGGC